jgi:pilus assembly protein Flp/PilA
LDAKKSFLQEYAMKNLFARFAKDESGATAIEYGLIAALVAVSIVAALKALSTQLNATFAGVTATMAAAK